MLKIENKLILKIYIFMQQFIELIKEKGLYKEFTGK